MKRFITIDPRETTIIDVGELRLTIEPAAQLSATAMRLGVNTTKEEAAAAMHETIEAVPATAKPSIRRAALTSPFAPTPPPPTGPAPQAGDFIKALEPGVAPVVASVEFHDKGTWFVLDRDSRPRLLRNHVGVWGEQPPYKGEPQVADTVLSDKRNYAVMEVMGEAETEGWVVRVGTKETLRVCAAVPQRWVSLGMVTISA